MKAVAGILGGFVVALGMFAGGVAAAVYFLAAEPIGANRLASADDSPLWTLEPRKVGSTEQEVRRVAAPSAGSGPDRGDRPEEESSIAAAEQEPATELDTLTTAAVSSPDEPLADQSGLQPTEPAADPRLYMAHLEWCANNYRSYRSSDNSYAPYSGGRQPCVSPYFEELQQAGGAIAAVDGDDVRDDGSFEVYPAEPQADALRADYVSGEEVYISAEHVEYCFSRYRSYRPEDNSYQPYGGGPRRQCM